ncbi:MAG: amidophosphoribosyltransferase [Coriobacteriaceae bacterium]|nr:amidophosphoribosyltransferase [Coriobacteriaceae bacterium]
MYGSHDGVADEHDHPEEACAVFGIYAPDKEVGRLTYFGLQALQHRGQESAGIAVGDGDTVMVNKDLGLVTQVFKESDFAALTGQVAIGHTRYSTSGGSSSWEASQPHLSNIGEEIVALAHNGTLVNTDRLRLELIERGISFRSTADSEVAAKLIGYFTQETSHMREGIQRTMELVDGAYAMVLATSSALYAFRDPYGIRPLVIGSFPDDEGYVLASETCALDIVGAEYLRDVAPGEVVRVDERGLTSVQALPPAKQQAFCIFEHVYFARPDSVFDGVTVYQSRVWMGRHLALEAPCDADVVLGVPDSGIPAAIGYSRESGIPYAEGIVKNRYVGRTFIQPTQELRQMGIRLKLNPMRAAIEGRRLVVIDDSIVRGNTSKQLVQMLRNAGAKEVHLRIVSPEIKWPCFYGIDTDRQKQLIAANKDVEEIREFTGADSLAYLSLDGLVSSIGMHGDVDGHVLDPGAIGETPETPHRRDCTDTGFCTACFNGVYPVFIPDRLAKDNFLDGIEPALNGSGNARQMSLGDTDELDGPGEFL